MFRSLLLFVIKKTLRKDYTPDPNLKSRDIFLILYYKTFDLLRGFSIKYFLGGCNGLLFLGKRCRIKHKSNLHLGRSVNIGDNVEINALAKEGVHIGNNVSILRNTIIECTGVIRNLGTGLQIGNNVGIAQNCFIQVRGRVVIEDDVIFGPGVSIFSENHNFSDTEKPIRDQGETRIGVTIRKGAWLGSGVRILDGVTVGEHTIIAAGSVVNKNVPAFCIAGGIPAKIIKELK
ncbi:MAG: acyltransferase [Ginsengibacter sp.]